MTYHNTAWWSGLVDWHQGNRGGLDRDISVSAGNKHRTIEMAHSTGQNRSVSWTRTLASRCGCLQYALVPFFTLL